MSTPHPKPTPDATPKAKWKGRDPTRTVMRVLKINIPRGVDPNGVFADIPKAVRSASVPPDGFDYRDFDLRILSHLLRRQFQKLNTKAIGDPGQYIAHLHRGFNPQDPVEEILTGTILLAYGRLAYLSHMAMESKDEFQVLPLYAAANETSTVLRKQLTCLANHRAPTCTATIVSEEPEKSTNELGAHHGKTTQPANPTGNTSNSPVDPQSPTLDPLHRT